MSEELKRMNKEELLSLLDKNIVEDLYSFSEEDVLVKGCRNV